MIRHIAAVILVSGLLLTPGANAAPLSPSAHFAYNVALNAWDGDTGACASVDAQMIPSLASPSMVAEYSPAPEQGQPCFIYLSRELAGSLQFAKTCEVIFNIIGTFHGRQVPTQPHVPRTCFMHFLFILNHPDYLRRRFR